MLKHYCFQFWRTPLALSTVSFACSLAYPLSAQVIPDNSLGAESSIVSPNVTVKDTIADLIEGGAIRGSNLFHSFEQFNVIEGSNVYFANPDKVTNILTRVTGNNISEIFGTLGTDGAADLFLLNPNGIVFGENAALDVSGSFLATTADSYVFENGFEYSTRNPQTPPVLTINLPTGIQMGANPPAIEVKGKGHNLVLDEFTFAPIRDNRPVGLEVESGNTLALLGGEINLTGGNLTAARGNIELGSVGEANTISLNPNDHGFTLDYGETNNFGDLNLAQASSIDVSGSGAGNINLRGKNVVMSDGSAILAHTLGADDGGKVKITTSESIDIVGTGEELFPSGLYSYSEGKGKTGDVTINSNRLRILDEAQIAFSALAAGNLGNLIINTSEIEMIGTGLFFDSEGEGNAGDVTINSDRLTLQDGAQIGSITYGEGDAGNLTVNVSDIEVIGTTVDGAFVSGLFSDSEGQGNAGDVTINGDRLVVQDGAQIGSGAFDEGNAGNLTVEVADIEIVGVNPNNFSSSGVFSQSQGQGDAGDVTINGDRLVVQDGAQISSSTLREGTGGNLTVNVSDIELIGANPDSLFPFPTGLFSQSRTTGIAGSLMINGDRLVVQDGAQISSSTFGARKGGNLTVNVADIELTGTTFDDFFASGLFSSSFFTGDAGDLTINGDRLVVQDGAQVSSGTFGEGRGGSLTVNVSDIEILGVNPSSVSPSLSGLFSASEGSGNAGNLTIHGDTLIIKDGGEISASTLNAGSAGDLSITMNNIEVTGTSADGNSLSNITASSQTDFPAGSLEIATTQLNVTDNAEILVSNIDSGDAGNLTITANEINLDRGGSLNAQVNAGAQGNINLTTDNINLDNQSQITVQASGTATGGNITIDNSNLILARNNSDIKANAVFGSGGNINISTKLIFTDLTSDIDASSEFGLDGVVEIKSPDSEKELGEVILPTEIVDPTSLITAACPSIEDNSLAVTGNGGVPNSPYQTQSLNTTWYDLRPVKQETSKRASLPTLLTEATATMIDAKGELELVALTPLSTHRWINSSCGNG